MAHAVDSRNIRFELSKKYFSMRIDRELDKKFTKRVMAQVPIVRCVGELLSSVSEGRFQIILEDVEAFPAGKGVTRCNGQKIPFLYVIYKVNERLGFPNIAICIKRDSAWEVYSANTSALHANYSAEIFSNIEEFLSDPVQVEGVPTRNWKPMRSQETPKQIALDLFASTPGDNQTN